MKTVEYLDLLRQRLALASDYQLSKVLQCSRAGVSNWRRGEKHGFDDETSVRVAELLHIDPAKVLADMAAERSESQRARVVWRRLAATLSLPLAILSGATVPEKASRASELSVLSTEVREYTLREIRRRRRASPALAPA